MGIRLIVEVLDHAPSTLSHRERLLLVVLAEDANDETRTTWNSVASPTVLRRSKLSRTQLYDVLKSLANKGAIKKTAGGQKNGTAKYTIMPLDIGQDPAPRDTDRTPQSPAPQDTETPQRPARRDTDGRFSVPESGTLTDSQSPAPQDTDDSQCPAGRDVSVPSSGTPTPHPSGVSTNTPAHRTSPQADRFSDFWTAYPRKVAKGAARTAWAKAAKRGADLDAVITAVDAHRALWKASGTDPKFIPYPASWLNAERYDDDLTQQPTAAAPAGPPQNVTQRYADNGVF